MKDKIVLVGTHGVGKSSLGKMLFEKLEMPLIDNITRKLISDVSEITSDDFFFQFKIVSLYLTEFVKKKRFISSRSFIDHLAYSRVNKVTEMYPLLEALIKDWRDRLMVIYIPIEFPMSEDPYRVKDETFRKRVDKEIVKILKEFHIPYMKVSGTIEERLKQILGGLYE